MTKMGHMQYLAGQTARNRLFGLAPRLGRDNKVPISMLISQQGRISHGRLAVVMFSICTVVLGIILSFVPWLDYLIFRELKLWNGSISYNYWQKPGVVRLTKVYIFNVTNPHAFLDHGEKPKLVEVGPFVYREDMEKVNIKFHDNDTVTFQHKKILRFVPEMSADKNQKLSVPNIPLLTLTSFSPTFTKWVFSMVLTALRWTYRDRATPFVQVTAEELVFGYEDPLVKLAHYVFPKGKRPNDLMGLLLARNGTLEEVSTIYTGQQSLERFGYLDKLDGRDHLTHWKDRPCNDIRASEGSFFPPRAVTHSDLVHIYDKDMCRTLPLQYRKDIWKDGILGGKYTPPSSTFECPDVNPDNKCYCDENECPPRGLQNISPCQYGAPVYLSNPHFFDADPSLIDKFEGMNPIQDKHETYFVLQPKLGVPLEGFVRVQLNLKITHSDISVNQIYKIPDIVFPVMWVEEGIEELTPSIKRWIYLATVVAPITGPVITYSMILVGIALLIYLFIKAYKNVVLGQNSIEIMELGRETIRRGSTLIINSSHKFLTCKENAYHALNNMPSPSTEEKDFTFTKAGVLRPDLSRSMDEMKTVYKSDFVKTNFGGERDSLIESDNIFIQSELRRCSVIKLAGTNF